MKFTLEEIELAVNSEFSKKISGKFGISTDTRTIKNYDIYLPLRGENFDGENFCNKALENGAAGCFYTKEKPCDVAIKVNDTKEAYLKIANFTKNKINPIVVGVTGSSGKTTTKEIIYSVLSEKFKTHKTFSNHNNEIGFCQTVLSMDNNCEVLIVEMGMRGLGEIELISKYAEPDFSVITNAGSAHIGRLGSLDNIARAKCEISQFTKNTLIASNNERVKKFANPNCKKIFYSINDVEILNKKIGYSKFSYQGKIYELNVEGEYNIENSLSAINLGYKLGMSYEEIKSGLLKYKPIEKRWEIIEISGYKFINDSYNANPESMKAAVSTFIDLYENPIVILGNMGELGENEIEFHKSVGEFLGKKFQNRNIKFITVGNLAQYIGYELNNYGFSIKHFNDNIETSRYILDNINIGNTIFLKASRSMKFEEILENISGGKL